MLGLHYRNVLAHAGDSSLAVPALPYIAVCPTMLWYAILVTVSQLEAGGVSRVIGAAHCSSTAQCSLIGYATEAAGHHWLPR